MMEIREKGLHEEIHYSVYISEKSSLLHMTPDDAISVYADGDELQSVLNAFTHHSICTIPYTGERCQMWFGDTAKSITYWVKHYMMKR